MSNEERERQWWAPVKVHGHIFNRPSFGVVVDGRVYDRHILEQT